MELDPAVILGPFLKSVGKVQELMENALGLPLPQADREILAVFQQEIRDRKAQFETLGPEFLQKSSQGLKDGMKQLEELQKEKDQVLEDLGRLQQRAAQAAQTAHQAAEEHAKKPRRPVPVPTATLPEPAKPLELSEGGVLRELLLLSNTPKPSGPSRKKLGNIWENWGPMGLPATHHDGETPHPASETPLLDELHEGSSPWS